MAFLQTITHRPSCIVSALPERFRSALAQTLKDSVAMTTCPVDELESAVRLRGASIVVVGASPDSIKIAEKLSHETPPVNVFVVHYRDRAASTPVNGFAGVFDLRGESEKLAHSIRQLVTVTASPMRSGPMTSSRRNPISLLLDLHRCLHNPAAFQQKTLEAFLDLAGARDGLLLLPQKDAPAVFRIGAHQNEGLFALEETVAFHSHFLGLLEDPSLLLPLSSEALTNDHRIPNNFTQVLPLRQNGMLQACLLFDQATDSPDLAHFCEGVSYLFQLLEQQHRKASREMIVGQARKMLSNSWIMTDSRGRIVCREGAGSSDIATSAVITKPRLLDAMARCAQEPVRVANGNSIILCRALPAPGDRHFLFELVRPAVTDTPRTVPVDWIENSDDASPQQKALLELLGQIVQLNEAASMKEALAHLGITMPAVAGIQTQTLAGLGVIAIGLHIVSKQTITVRHFQGQDADYFGFEATEEGLPPEGAGAGQPFIDWVLSTSALPILSSWRGHFGLQVKLKRLS